MSCSFHFDTLHAVNEVINVGRYEHYSSSENAAPGSLSGSH